MMTARTRFGLAGALLLVLVAAGFASAFAVQRAGLKKLEHSFPAMGTGAAFTFWGAPEKAELAAKNGRAEFDRVVRACNLYDPESELAKLNRSAAEAPFGCSDELWVLLSEARQAYEFSGGAFDITAKPLMDLWGFYRRRGDSLPSEAEIAEAKKRVGLDKVVFDDEKQTVKFTVPGMAFDLGGIA